jgi:cytoskeletal protein CcmA (bactofilin family)
MVIDGVVQGTISTGQNIAIGKNAQIEANIKAGSVVVAGRVKGNIIAKDRLELTPGSRVDGDVTTKTLVVAEGAILNGKCSMGGTESGNARPPGPKENNGAKRPLT